MLRLDKARKTLQRLKSLKLADAGLLERTDVQQMIYQNPDAFFKELGEPLLLIGQEIEPADFVGDRIDLLAIDAEGAAVVIELKRGSHKLQMLQALSYAGMIAKWEPGRFLEKRRVTSEQAINVAQEEIAEFLESEDIWVLNNSQRIILLAEEFDYEVLVTAEWLTEKYDADIKCYRLALSVEAENHFLTCTCIYPPPEITAHATKRKIRDPSPRANWDTVLARTDNPDVVVFFRTQLDGGRENNANYRRLQWRSDVNKRRFRVNARQKYMMVTQYGRFLGDVDFWVNELGNEIRLREVNQGDNLRFLVQLKEQIEKLPQLIERHRNTALVQEGSPDSDEGEDGNDAE